MFIWMSIQNDFMNVNMYVHRKSVFYQGNWIVSKRLKKNSPRKMLSHDLSFSFEVERDEYFCWILLVVYNVSDHVYTYRIW